jgi:SSS family solute:Na+ symporter
MKIQNPGIVPATALPLFIMEKTPPMLGGAILATLLVAIVGTGAGLSLGLSSMIYGNLCKPYIKTASDKKELLLNRAIIAVILLAAAFFSSGNAGSMILGWSFLSMGLRGSVAFGPLCAALFMPGKIHGRYVFASMLVGPALVLLGKALLPAYIDPLFPGIAGNLAVLAAGLLLTRRE